MEIDYHGIIRNIGYNLQPGNSFHDDHVIPHPIGFIKSAKRKTKVSFAINEFNLSPHSARPMRPMAERRCTPSGVIVDSYLTKATKQPLFSGQGPLCFNRGLKAGD